MNNLLKIFIIFIACNFCLAKGITWSKVFQNDTLLFMGIDNPDSNYCMALASFGPWRKILKSTDAGLTWFYVYNDSNWSKYPYDISYPTRNFCIVACDSSTFLKTTDGGKNWNEYKVDIPYTFQGFRDVDMLDENNGVMISDYYVVVSHDGFKTWDTIPAPGGYMIYCVAMAEPNSISVVSRDIDGSPDFNERFYRSDDGGKTWDEYPHPDYRIPKSLQFVDSYIGYEVGGKRTGKGDLQYELVYKTSDGGRSWVNVLDTVITVSFGLQALDFYDKDNGIVVGQFGAIFWTHDGGKSWFYDSSTTVTVNIPATMNVCYIRKDRAIIVDFVGRIFISSEDTTDVVEIPFLDREEMSISPNPTSEFIKLRFSQFLTNNSNIKLFNSFGQEIEAIKQKRINENEFEVDVSSLPAGVYFVVITSMGKVYSKPFVVMR